MSSENLVEIAEELTVEGYEDYRVIKLQGEVDAHTFDQFEQQIEEVIASENKIIFNCQDLDYINSAGVGLLLSISSDGKEIIFSRFNEEVRETLEMLGFLDLFKIEDFEFYGEKKDEIELTITAESKHLKTVREKIQDKLTSYQEDESEIYKIITALGETLSNIMEHSLDFKADRKIDIKMQIFSQGVVFDIKNDGPCFEPDQDEKQLKEFVNDNSRRGLGLYIVHSLLDRVEYKISAEGENHVRLEKSL